MATRPIKRREKYTRRMVDPPSPTPQPGAVSAEDSRRGRQVQSGHDTRDFFRNNTPQMPRISKARPSLLVGAALAVCLASGPVVRAQEKFEPTVGMAGKDVVWVPTTPALVERMLDLARVTPDDFVMDLGSGDGRNIIAAAKRGARGVGVEFNPEMVELSRRLAREAGVADKATFVQGDMYEADISKATVLALFLLPSNLEKLKDKILALRPGTRVVLNTFTLPGWQAETTEHLQDGCVNWCTAILHIIPARVAGTWRLDGNELLLDQEFQSLSGTFTVSAGTVAVTNARIKADAIEFSTLGTSYVGRVDGDRMTGTATGPDGTKRAWTAARVSR